MSDQNKQRDPFEKLLENVKLSARYGSKGGSFSKYRELPQKEVLVDASDLRRMFIEQCGTCHWLQIPLNPYDIFVKSHPLAMSVDRLDNTKGYSEDNIVICSRLMNLGKSAADAELWESVIDRLELYGAINYRRDG